MKEHAGHEDQLSMTVPALDRYRIVALEKILASNILNESQKKATISMLDEKRKIYMAGASKRETSL